MKDHHHGYNLWFRVYLLVCWNLHGLIFYFPESLHLWQWHPLLVVDHLNFFQLLFMDGRAFYRILFKQYDFPASLDLLLKHLLLWSHLGLITLNFFQPFFWNLFRAVFSSIFPAITPNYPHLPQINLSQSAK